ncbi:MAG TPA: ATP-binding protein, partial [Terriglobales bacterium]|nr:ATP-binding protein [Terriglobales bacterium]
AHGHLMVRHTGSSLVSELDGYSVRIHTAPAGALGRVYESPAGQLWVASSTGLLEHKEGGGWTAHPVDEIAHSFSASLEVPPLCPVRQGTVIFLLPDRVMEYTTDDSGRSRVELLKKVSETGVGRFTAFWPAHDGGLWLVGTKGLVKVPTPLRNFKSTTECHEYLVPEGLHLHDLREVHEDDTGTLTLLADSTQAPRPLMVTFDGEEWTTQDLNLDKVRSVWRSSDHRCWAFTPSALYEWEEGAKEPVENDEISARRYFDVVVEPGGAFWLATSDGLYRYAPPAWRAPAALRGFNGAVRCLASDKADRLWFVSGSALHSYQGQQISDFPFQPSAARLLQNPQGLYAMRDGSLILETGNGLFRVDTETGKLSPNPQEAGQETRILGYLSEGTVCAWRSHTAGPSPPRLEVFDGTRFSPLTEAPPLEANESPTIIYPAQNGDLWLGSEHSTAWYHDRKWRVFSSSDKSSPEAPAGFIEVPERKIWCAAQDKIWEFDGHVWSVIHRGFDRISAILRGRDGMVWLACNSGVLRFFQGSWVDNGVDEGLPATGLREVFEDQRGRIWAAGTHGLRLHRPEADPDPPQTYLQEFRDTERNIPEGSALILTFSGQDKWKYTSAERLLFSYRLDQHDWSPFLEANTVSFNDLPAGKHYFQVRAMDRNCNYDPKPQGLDFEVILPWFKETRLVLISALGLGIGLFFAGLAFNRHRRLVRSHAEVERKIAERTRELEIASHELLQSQKMTALGTLAAGIAHDFNNILSIIKGSAQIIEDNVDNPEKVRTRINRINTVVEQGAGIVKAMLGFSRDSGVQPRPGSLNDMVKETMQLLGDRFLREVEVGFKPSDNLPPAAAVKDFVQQILLNFIFNAEESMANPKRIIIRTARITTLPSLMVLLPRSAAAYVTVSVQDFGCGISTENLPRIFEPFFTTKALSARRGTGLGLSMVYELAKKMQAGLIVESVL